MCLVEKNGQTAPMQKMDFFGSAPQPFWTQSHFTSVDCKFSSTFILEIAYTGGVSNMVFGTSIRTPFY